MSTTEIWTGKLAAYNKKIGNRRAERLRINGSAKFNFCSSIKVQY